MDYRKEEIEHRTPEVILSSIIEKEKRIFNILDELTKILEKGKNE